MSRVLVVAALAAALAPGSAAAARGGAHIALACAFEADAFCSRLLAELQAAGHVVDRLPDGTDIEEELAAPGAVVQVRQSPWEVVVTVRRGGVLETRTYRPDAGEANPAQTVAVRVAEGLRAALAQETPTPEPAPADSAPRTATRPVRFDAGDRHLQVSVDRAASCVTPCELSLSPGVHRVRVVGREDEELLLPDSPAMVRLSSRSNLRLGLGIAGLSVGVPLAGVGLFLAGAGVGARSPDQDYSRVIAAGSIVAAVGVLAATLGGVSLGLMGADRVQVQSAAPQLQALGVAVVPGSASLGACFTF